MERLWGVDPREPNGIEESIKLLVADVVEELFVGYAKPRYPWSG